MLMAPEPPSIVLGVGAQRFNAYRANHPTFVPRYTSQNFPGVDLRDFNLAGADFTGSNLSNANLGRAVFTGATLDSVNFDGADFADAEIAGASLRNARLVGARFNNANLTAANFTDANLTQADLRTAKLKDTTFFRASLQDAKVNISHLQQANVRNANLTSLDLTGISLVGHDLPETNFSNAKLEGADFSGANLKRAIFNGSSAIAAKFIGADLSHARLDHSNLSVCDFQNAVLDRCDLTGTNLDHANLTGARFREAILTGARMRETKGVYEARDLLSTRIDGEISYITTIVRYWYERWLDWERIRVAGRLPLFGASYAGLVIIPIYIYGLGIWNDKVLFLADWITRAGSSLPPDTIGSVLRHLRPEPIPDSFSVLFVSTICLAVAATIYALACPARVKAFSRDQWCDEHRHPLIHYWAEAWKLRWLRLLCASLYLIGGTGAAYVLLSKLWRVAVILSESPWS